MAETGESEALITEIIKTIKEYTKKDINNLEEVKAEFKENLKTHRPIKLCDYEFGFSHTGKKNNYIIIKEENDKSKVRQFLKQKDYWYCSKRTYVAHKCISPSLRIKYDILFAPLNHAKECMPKEYSFAMKVQRLLKEGKIKEAKGLTISKKRLSNNTSNQSLSTSILSTTDIENESILDLIDEISENADSNISSLELSQTQFPDLTGNEKESGRSSVKTEIDNDDYEETEFER
uniref:Uncharacterized protein n=1 Tax=Panagrolaimus davidi TaxID=227884 RepID=A0A914P4V9_9BILA